MLTTTSLIVITTVIIQGGAANFLLNWLKIPYESSFNRCYDICYVILIKNIFKDWSR